MQGWVASKHSAIVPARSVRIIPGSVTAEAGGQIYYGVVEELESVALPRGLIMSPVYMLLSIDKGIYRVLLQTNLGREDLYLKPNTVLGCSINGRDSPRLWQSYCIRNVNRPGGKCVNCGTVVGRDGHW